MKLLSNQKSKIKISKKKNNYYKIQKIQRSKLFKVMMIQNKVKTKNKNNKSNKNKNKNKFKIKNQNKFKKLKKLINKLIKIS